MNKWYRWFFYCTLFGITLSLSGKSVLSNLDVHGFVSQGFLKSNYNNYLVNSVDGSFEFNEAALTTSIRVSDNLRIGMQLFARDLGSEGNNNVVIDWAYGDYRIKDYLGIRIGKIKTPVGQYNQGRDVDLLRTSILLPQGVYQESMRDFILAFQGASAYGNLMLGILGDIDYECYYGTLNVPETDSNFWKNIFTGLQDTLTRQLPEGSTASVEKPDVTMKYVVGGAVKWNSPLQGLNLRGSYATGKLNIDADIQAVVPLMEIQPGLFLNNFMNIPLSAKIDVQHFYTLSAEYSHYNLTATAEYLIENYDFTIEGKKLNYKGEGYYFLTDYRFSDYFAIGSYYSVHYPRENDKTGDYPAKWGDPRCFAWQKDWCTTLRFDINHNWLIKLEYHLINGCGQVRKFDNPSGEIKENWMLYGLKTTYHF